MVFFIFACSNTRVVMEGVKKVINNQEEEKPEKNKSNIYSKGHYKIGKPYTINNITYTPKLVSYYNENGIASWYGPKFHQKLTANGEIFDGMESWLPWLTPKEKVLFDPHCQLKIDT